MSRYFVFVLVTGALGCMESQQGQNWSPDTPFVDEDAATLEIMETVEEVPKGDPIGPAFGNDYGFKTLLNQEAITWNRIHGVTQGHRVYVVAGGTLGTVYLLDEWTQTWTSLSLPNQAEVKGVWMDGPESIAVCGQDGLLRRYRSVSEGGQPFWNLDDAGTGKTETLNAIHGTDIQHLWAVGERSLALRLSNDQWSALEGSALGLPDGQEISLLSVFAVSEDEVYIGGQDVLIHGVAGEFTANLADFAGYRIFDIFVRGLDVWLATDNAAIFHLNAGDGSITKHQPNTYSQFRGIWVGPSGIVLAAAYMPPPIVWSFDGNLSDNWTTHSVASPKRIADLLPGRINSSSRLHSIWGISYENFFVATHSGQIIQYALHP